MEWNDPRRPKKIRGHIHLVGWSEPDLIPMCKLVDDPDTLAESELTYTRQVVTCPACLGILDYLDEEPGRRRFRVVCPSAAALLTSPYPVWVTL